MQEQDRHDDRHDEFYRGFIKLRSDKRAAEKFKDVPDEGLRTWEECAGLEGCAGVLREDAVLVDIDDSQQAEALLKLVYDLQINCRVLQTSRGMHFLFKNSKARVDSCLIHQACAVGLYADYKVACKNRKSGKKLNSYQVLRQGGADRACLYDIEQDEQYDEIPIWLLPLSVKELSLFGLRDGDGRNQKLFVHILTLQKAGMDREQIREVIRYINKYMFAVPLENGELECTVLRDESFVKGEKQIEAERAQHAAQEAGGEFFDSKGRFLHMLFSDYIIAKYHVITIDKVIYIFNGICYDACLDNFELESIISHELPFLTMHQIREAYFNIHHRAPRREPADPRFIAFQNCIYDVMSDSVIEPDSDLIVTSMIPHCYNPNIQKSEVVEQFLDLTTCRNMQVRALMEEMFGYCFYKSNKRITNGKFFVLVGDKGNGKSTVLNTLSVLLGKDSCSNLDLRDLDHNFRPFEIFGKMANLGDDISSEILSQASVSMLKKFATGDRVTVERKGKDPISFSPFAKMIFSANVIPRIPDQTGAVERRMVIIPLRANFLANQDICDPDMESKLTEEDAMEYLILLAVRGLKRIVKNKSFTTCDIVERELQEYSFNNDPLEVFLDELGGKNYVLNRTCTEVYSDYSTFAELNRLKPLGANNFSKQLCKKLGISTVRKYVASGRRAYVFTDQITS